MTTNAGAPACNLLDEPWIPVRSLAGEIVDVSLTEALRNARAYVALAETSPPNLIALYRLLLAALHRALTTHHGQWKDADRARWFREGLPDAPIRAYLEQWRERFWLFHPTQPFMQVAALAVAEETREKLKAWTQIAVEKPSPSEPAVFDHAIDTQPIAVPAVKVLRDLLGYLQVVPGKLVQAVKTSDKAGPLANTAAIMPSGSTLAETLLLGLHPYDAKRADDLPAWERNAPSLEHLRAAPTLASGANDRYSRLSRAVLLVPENNGQTVRHIRFAAGLALEDDPQAPDPMACYSVKKDGKAVRVSFREGRAVWRDLPSLVPDPSKRTDIPPAILNWAADLYQEMHQWDAQAEVLSAGLASDQAKLLRWRVERLVLPQALLRDVDAAADLRMQARLCEDTFFRLRALAAELIANTMPDPGHKDTRSRARALLDNGPVSARYFSSAEQALPRLMQRLAAGDIDTAHREWKAALQRAASDAWETGRQCLGDSPAVLRADARLYPRFIGLLKSLTPPIEEPMTEEVNP